MYRISDNSCFSQNINVFYGEEGKKRSMKLSDILKKSLLAADYEIIREKEFDTFERVSYQGKLNICVAINDTKYISKITKRVTMIMIPQELNGAEFPEHVGLCIVSKPWELLFLLHNWLYRNEISYGRNIFRTRIGKNCKISPLAYIAEENVIIGDNVTIEEFVSIKSNTVIKNNAVIMTGCVLGGDGLEYKKMDNRYFYVEHAGGTIIEEDVSLHANVNVNKAVFPEENTIVGAGTKVDSFSIIAHGAKVGKNSIITTSCALAGRAYIGDEAFLSPGVMVSHNLDIGSRCVLNIGAVVTTNLTDESVVSGNFAIEHKKFIKHIKAIS